MKTKIVGYYVVTLRFRWSGDYNAWIRMRRRIRRFLRASRLEWLDTIWDLVETRIVENWLTRTMEMGPGR